jgi:hypothetical protein
MACQLMTNELKNPFFLFACLTKYGSKSKQQLTKKLQIQGCLSLDHLSAKRKSVSNVHTLYMPLLMT